MILQLSNGTYLHTAYAVSNIPEEFTQEDWSLTSQEGMHYIGTYIDSSSVESTDPTQYSWEELLDTAIDDTDSEGEMPVADYQAQIDALQDQVSILQTDKEDLAGNIEINANNVATASELGSTAQDLALEANQVAQATGQHFWSTEELTYFLSTDTTVDTGKTYYSYDGTDYTEVTPIGTEDPSTEGWYEALGTGAYVTAQTQDEFKQTPTGKNSLWNSLGMLFRSGLNYLLAILAGGADGTGPKGIAIYDGQGNSESNIVAQFTDSGSVLGKQNNGQLALTDANITLTDQGNKTAFTVQNRTTTDQGTITDRVLTTTTRNYEGIFTHQLSYDYLGGLVAKFGYGEAGPGVRTQPITLAVADFGPWTLDNTTHNVHASGTIAFDSNTNTVTLTVEQTQHGTYDNFFLYFDLLYTSYIQAPILTIGEIDPVYMYTTDRLLIGDTNGIHFTVTKAGKVYAQNIGGYSSEDYTGYYRMGGCVVLTGSVTINVTTANTNTDRAITFGHTFKYKPAISVSMLNIGGSYYQRVTAAGPTTTGFTARVRAGGTPGNVTVVWMAIGEEAT